MRAVFKVIVILCICLVTISSSKKMPNNNDKIESIQKQSAGKWPTLTGEPTQLMAHRGEKVLMPEHTQGSYTFAAIEGADYVEPDLVLTKDGILVCFHDLTLKAGTDVSILPQFANKKKTFIGMVDEGGPDVTILDDWFIIDFTLAELKTLTVVQKDIGIRPQFFNDLFKIPTFEEYLDTVHHSAYLLNKSIGIIPELKHPWLHNIYHNATPNFMETLTIETLARYGYPMSPLLTPDCRSAQDDNASISCGHLILQSFEFNCIKYLSGVTSADRMMLVSPYGPVQLPLLTYKGMIEISEYAQYYAIWKELMYVGILVQLETGGIEYDKELIEQMGGFVDPMEIPTQAHALGMAVGIYTIYDSREPSNRGCATGVCDPENKELELFYYFKLGVDGMFVENVMEARELRQKFHYQFVENIYQGGTNRAGGRIKGLWGTIVGLVIVLFFRICI